MRNLKAKLKNKKGFTLVELVVVIAVLAILAAIAIPVVTGVVNKANAATDAANAQSYESAFKMLTAEMDLNVDDRLPAYKAVTVGPITAGEALKYANINNFSTGTGTDKEIKAKQTGFKFWYNKTSLAVACAKAAPSGYEAAALTTETVIVPAP